MPRSARVHRRVGVLAAAVIVAVLLARNAWIFGHAVVEDGDFAANSILIDEALRGRLLTGNYSRMGFHHPGPALLYVLAGGQLLFFQVLHLVPAAFNGQILGVVVWNGCLVGVCTSILGRHLRRPVIAAVLPLLVLAAAVWQPGFLVSAWPPDLYVVPFLLLLVATGSVLAGDTRDLPFVVLALGVLVHGHVSFILVAAGFSVLVAARWLQLARRRQLAVSRRTLVASALIAAMFALPIVLNLVLNWPGDWAKYARYSTEPRPTRNGIIESVGFVGQYWWVAGVGGVVVAAALFVAAAWAARSVKPRPARDALLGVLAAAVLATVLTFVYAWRGVDSLEYAYTIEYYWAVPIAVLAVLVVALGALLDRRRAWFGAVAAAAVASAAILALQPSQVAAYQGTADVRAVEGFVNGHVPASSTWVLEFSHENWPLAAGVLEDRRRLGLPVCIGDAGFATVLSEAAICSEAQRREGTVVWFVSSSQRPPSGRSGPEESIGSVRVWIPD